jgi:hypothetical protein
VSRVQAPRLEVEFTRQALLDLRRVVPARSRARVKRLITESLSHDPRNPRDQAQLRPDKELAFFILHYDAYFHIRGRRAVVGRVAHADESARRRPPLAPGLV